MAPQPLIPSSKGIWTIETSQEFYKSARELNGELGDGKKLPGNPVDYRVDNQRNTESSSPYTLSYNEELDLADHFAFLAAVVGDDPDYVSATVLEEQRDTPGLVLRLASNRSPKNKVVDRLSSIIQIVQDHALAVKGLELHKWRLFDEIIDFSQERIHGRLKSAQWKQPGRFGKRSFSPLHVRLDRKLKSIRGPALQSREGIVQFQTDLLHLCTTLKELDKTPEHNQFSKLKEILLQCHGISNHDALNSLEKRLEHFGISQTISQASEVRQIDKLSKYWQICLDLTRRSRQPKTRPLFQNFKLDNRTAPPSGQPEGSEERCSVHGEVQLVLFYEENKMAFPPRVIGSSKSACFLCDQFVKIHGKFGISHSHMRLYTQWMIPDSEWMSSEQRTVFRKIVGNMNAELKRRREIGGYVNNRWAESKANVWEWEEESSITSSIVSSALAPPTPPSSLKRNGSSSSSSTIRPMKPETAITPPAETTRPTQNSPAQRPSSPRNSDEGFKLTVEQMTRRSETRTPTQDFPVQQPKPASEEEEEEEEEIEESSEEDSAQGSEEESEDQKNSKAKPKEMIPTMSLTQISPIQQPRSSSKEEECPKIELGETRTQPRSVSPQPSQISETEPKMTRSSLRTPSPVQNPPEQRPSRDSKAELQENGPSSLPRTVLSEQHLIRNYQEEKYANAESDTPSSPTRKLRRTFQVHPAQEPGSSSKQGEDQRTEREERTSPPRSPTPSRPRQRLERAERAERRKTRKTKKHYKYRNLPFSFPIHPSTKSFTLSTKPVGHKKVRYTFDLEAISHGKVEIFQSIHRRRQNRINIKKMRGGDEVDVRPNKGVEKLEFDMCFGWRNSERLGVVITWREGDYRKEKRKENFWTRLPSSLSSWWHGGMTRSREERGKERPQGKEG